VPGAHQNYQFLGAGGLYGGNIVGHGTALPSAISELDSQRLGIGRTPQAEYPDGYLGTIRSRRDDRVLDAAKSRVNQRSYQRGVHKGERIDQSDYYYPVQLQPDRGLRNQARGMRTTFVEQLTPPPKLVNDGKAQIEANEPGRINAKRKEQLQRLMPMYR
jgi:hypothetical protein